ncbi:uncharacterized protein LOC127378154 isoform X2 [Dicentrarchus labrax]|uniref:uncharacterized protein LOC127378154 isoform X2 n=1 Tax=Dicentrarchus labrax TaxID=13489 RepID=UPI0021F52565|nr:uncharacterized protein LOC127378154 isoform X2 [Dicentrarchus labrax]
MMMMMMMMRGVTLIFVSYVWVQVNSQEIKVECHEFYGKPPPVTHISPSFLADLKVKLLTGEERYTLNISWAINIDASIQHLTGTRIVILGEPTHHCEYNPPLANLTTSMQKWFHYLVRVSYGFNSIQVANLPLPQKGSGSAYKEFNINIPKPYVPKPIVPIVKSTTYSTTLQDSTRLRKETVPANVSFTNIVVGVFGVLAVLMILVHTCYIIYKNCGAKFATSLGFKMLPTSPVVPVPVLVVYPAENLAFQRAVVALAEFLQWQGDCSVAIDMWQQGKIAELGPMRWLAEQAKAADRVLIVCPQPSSQPSDYPPNHILPDPSIPAAAHDLFPLILNMVASHAKSAHDLAKFWVVQLGGKCEKRPSNLALELRACKTFCLMKDLNRLYRSLHQDNKKIPNLVCRPGVEQSTVKLREAIEKLVEHQQRILKEVESLKSVVTTI